MGHWYCAGAGPAAALRGRPLVCSAFLATLALATTAALPAQALTITPSFDSSITSNANASAIEGAINMAIGTIDGLFANPVNITVTFTYDAAAPGNLESTVQTFYGYSYSSYTKALAADAAANPQNTVLATAVANLSKGNDANGRGSMAITGAQSILLSAYGLGTSGASDAVININKNQAFAFSRPVSSSQFDAVGGLEHELDEVLGGGGAGSTLNPRAGSCQTTPNGFFCNKFGATDLYRYSAAGTPSFSTSGTATAYLSVDGGTTDIVGFNQDPAGDYGDFAPNCGTGGGTRELIQNAFNCKGQDEAYTTASPEFAMLEAIGWDPVPEPETLALFAGAVIGIVTLRRRAIG